MNFYLFPSTPHRKIHPEIKKLTVNENFKIFYGSPINSISNWAIDLVLRNRYRGHLISKLVAKQDINIIHAIELNHAGFLVLNASKIYNDPSKTKIATVWGSDIFWFSRFKSQRNKLSAFLKNVDLLISECQRDEKLAIELGFQGKFVNSPSLFGFSENELNQKQQIPSERKIVLVKGYESFVGRASLSLLALEELDEQLSGFEIHVYSTTFKTRKLIKKIKRRSNLKITGYKKRSLSSSEMFDLFGRSRIHLGVSLSDGVPASLLESMVFGAFPIQTNTSCAEQWIENEKSGLLISPNLEEIKQAVQKAIIDDFLVNNAAEINLQKAKLNLNEDYVSKNIMNVYS